MQRVHVWLPLSVLAVAVCSAVVLHFARQPPPPSPRPAPPLGVAVAVAAGPVMEPHQSSDLVRDYRAHNINVRSVPLRDGDTSDVYLFFEGGPPDPLGVMEVPQDPDYADRWKAVILARFVPDRRLDRVILTAWRNCGLRMGPYLLFGDPVWITRTREMMLQDGRSG